LHIQPLLYILHIQMATKPKKTGFYLYMKRRSNPYAHVGHLVVEALEPEAVKEMVHKADLAARVDRLENVSTPAIQS